MDRMFPKGAYYDKRRNNFKSQITFNKHNNSLGNHIDPITCHILYTFTKTAGYETGLLRPKWTKESQRRYDEERRKSGKLRKARYRRRFAVMKKIGYSCTLCGGKYIHFHHTVPMVHDSDMIHYEKFWSILIPLCPKCHLEWHKLKDWLGVNVM